MIGGSLVIFLGFYVLLIGGENLANVGYISAAAAPPSKKRYTEADDPKRLIALDADIFVVPSVIGGHGFLPENLVVSAKIQGLT